MKLDWQALLLRLVLAWFLLSATTLFLSLVGTAQSFLEPVQKTLFQMVRGFSWVGILISWCVLAPWTRKAPPRLAASLVLGTAFALIFGFVLLWGSWIYPKENNFPW